MDAFREKDRTFVGSVCSSSNDETSGNNLFSARMHERYLFPAAALSVLAFIYLKDKRLLLLCIGFSAASYINTHSILFGAGGGMNSSAYTPVLMFTSLLNVVLFLYLVKVLYDISIKKGLHSCIKKKSMYRI